MQENVRKRQKENDSKIQSKTKILKLNFQVQRENDLNSPE